jgi:hypothetical protein
MSHNKTRMCVSLKRAAALLFFLGTACVRPAAPAREVNGAKAIAGPTIAVWQTQYYAGRQALFGGRTQLGARVSVEGRSIAVAADGSFSFSLSTTETGSRWVLVRAVREDSETVRRIYVRPFEGAPPPSVAGR